MQMKLMLVDDHLLFIEGLQYLLETYGISIIGKAKNGYEALLKARILKPNIILMDIRMPECDGVNALKFIKAEMPDIKIIMLTTSEEDQDLFDAIKYGASGYLLKSTDAKDLIDMLLDIENGGVPLSQGLTARILKEFQHKHEQVEISSQAKEKHENELTSRQLEVLELTARGAKYKEVGEILGISERTVKYHMERIINLLHLENKAQVIAYATRKGILEDTTQSGHGAD